jgi:hypothetical protein
MTTLKDGIILWDIIPCSSYKVNTDISEEDFAPIVRIRNEGKKPVAKRTCLEMCPSPVLNEVNAPFVSDPVFRTDIFVQLYSRGEVTSSLLNEAARCPTKG